MLSIGFWLLGKREGTLLPSQHTSVPMADPDTQQMQAARSHITEQSRPTSQARIREERDGPDHQPVSTEERKQDRVEAECIENRREDKVGEELGQPGRRRCKMEGGLFQESRERV